MLEVVEFMQKLALTAPIIILLAMSPQAAHPGRLRSDLPYFSCSTFPADESEADLVKRFGSKNVTNELIEGGGAEGDMNPGTVLFAGQSDSRAEIFWKDAGAKTYPDWISVDGGTSRWRSPAGITLGTDLLTVEKLNGRPFRLLGFGYDSEGAVTSWAGGRLDADKNPQCRFKVWVSPTDRGENVVTLGSEKEVIGDREYSSGHPTMQRLDPIVYKMYLLYEQ